MSILSTNQRLISIGESYSAGNGIDITDQIISVTGDATPYSAGDNIDIQDHIISGKDWSQDITDASANAYNETTAWVQENYANSADMTYISGVVDNKLDTTAWSTVSGNLATEDYVIMADNINYNQMSAFVINQHYASESNLNSAFDYLNENKLDNSAFNLPNSANWNKATSVVETNSADWGTITAFSSTSSVLNNQVTALRHDLITVITNTGYLYNDLQTTSGILSGAIDYVSANAGDEFPASANEAITAYQNASGTYLTAHQPISANEWNNVYETVETNSGSWAGGTSLTGDAQGAVDEVYSNSADWNSNYSTVNANSGTWTNGGFTGEVYGISGVSPNVEVYIDQNTLWISAAAGGAGNPEVESYVQTNSANIDDAVSTYQTNSGSYITQETDWTNTITAASSYAYSEAVAQIPAPFDPTYMSGAIDQNASDIQYISSVAITAHQDISNKLDTTAFSTVSGTFLTAHQDISANEWNSVYDTVEANSGSWTGGGGGSIDTIPVAVISPLVTGFSGESAYLGIESTALNLSSYVPVSAIGVNSYGYVNQISGRNISAFYSRNALTANYANTADRAYHDRNNNEITSYYQPKLTITGDAGTITSINGSAVGASIPEGWELVAGQGIEIADDAENNQTTISVTGGGDLSNYYTKTETSSKIELDNAIGNIETLLASL